MWGAAIAGLLLSVTVYAFIERRPAESAVDAPTMREILSGFAVALRNHKVWLVAGGGAIAAAPNFIFGSLWGVPYLMQVHGLKRTVAASLTATILAGWGFGGFFEWLVVWSHWCATQTYSIWPGRRVYFAKARNLRTQAVGSRIRRTVSAGRSGFWHCGAFLRNGGGLINCGDPGFRICICQYADDTFRCDFSTGRRLVARSELVWTYIKWGAHIQCSVIRIHSLNGACHLRCRPRYDLARPVR